MKRNKFDFHKFKKYLPLILACLMAFTVISAPIAGHALDFGDFAGDNDYGGGGGDWGGGGGDWDYDDGYSSSSSDDDDGFILWWLFKVVYDLFGVPGVIVLLLIFAGIYLVRNRGKKAQPMQQPKPQGAQRTDRSTLAPIHTYLQLDPGFEPEEFKEKLSNLYVQFQNGWQDKNIASLRPYLSDAMYAQMDRQLETYRQKNQTNHVERISVLGVELCGWKQSPTDDVIIAELRTRIVDYVTDDNTGVIVRGSDSQEKFMTYEWTLIRTRGQQTQKGAAGTTGQTCPHCGAHIDINHTAVCEYCGSVLTTDKFDWVVSNIKGISQRTQ
ncbi:MAG: TIM44-like domain-containing protein [Oscillospiraceae bacterium]|nr:TIM44-like domain-containing protein [Oscillospiraceae bacterium]